MTESPSIDGLMELVHTQCAANHLAGREGMPFERIGMHAIRAYAESLAHPDVDAQRLDWLDSDGCTRVLKLGGTWYTRQGYGSPHQKAGNLRAAIDAARRHAATPPLSLSRRR